MVFLLVTPQLPPSAAILAVGLLLGMASWAVLRKGRRG